MSSMLSRLSVRSSSPDFSRASSPSVASVASSHPPVKSLKTPTASHPLQRPSLKPYMNSPSTHKAVSKSPVLHTPSSNLHSKLVAAVEWDVDAKADEAEYELIEKDGTVYELGETSCDESKPASFSSLYFDLLTAF